MKGCTGSLRLWEAENEPMAFWPLKGVQQWGPGENRQGRGEVMTIFNSEDCSHTKAGSRGIPGTL